MKIEIGSYRFPGFYESIFCNSDEFIDDESELEFELKEKFNKYIEVCYEYENFDKYKKDVCIAFMDEYVNKIIEVLPYEITENKNFKFKIIEDKDNIIVDSPKYYNYRTDRCFCEIETNIETLDMIKNHTLKLDDAKNYILRNFTSRDGFISFLSNDIDYWKSLEVNNYEENMIIALLDMLLSLSDCTAFEEIAMAVYYDVDKYCYASPVIYYNGKKITINELKRLDE